MGLQWRPLALADVVANGASSLPAPLRSSKSYRRIPFPNIALQPCCCCRCHCCCRGSCCTYCCAEPPKAHLRAARAGQVDVSSFPVVSALGRANQGLSDSSCLDGVAVVQVGGDLLDGGQGIPRVSMPTWDAPIMWLCCWEWKMGKVLRGGRWIVSSWLNS